MQGLILAAGMGKRLKELTRDNTKCMVKVNGVTLIERSLSQLDELGLKRIIIVVGYRGQNLIDFISTLSVKTPIVFINNPIYDKTNNIYSLSLAKSYLLEDDTLLLESDMIFEEGVLKALAEDPRDTLALVDKYEGWMDGTVIKIGPDDSIEDFIPGKRFRFDEIAQYYKTVNIYKFGKEFSQTHYVPFLDAYCKALGNNEYYEQVLRVIALLDDPGIRAKRLDGQRWYEIDDVQDLDIACSLFAPDEETRLSMLQSRYGGYWRYPHMKDFCYLVNPYYPPQKLRDELKANLSDLLTQYPSGMKVNSLVAARNFSVHPEHIAVGNGAAELIKSLMGMVRGKAGFIRPTFEEYPNRFRPEDSVVFTPETDGFTYTADDLIAFFSGKNLSLLTLINPDNPSGNYLPKAEVLRLAGWCAQQKIRLLADESFADFADEDGASLISEETFARFPELLIVKSISKSYGVPGLRLGILAGGDEALIAAVKKDVSIWNINSFAEFYMQIEQKYHKDYAASLRLLKKSRAGLQAGLSAIPGIRVFPSQANFLMAEITSGMSSRELTRRLLSEDKIFLKDLSGKIHRGNRQFIRAAVRSEEDNQLLVQAVRRILG